MRVHPHMLRHACGYKLANDARDTRTIQDYLGHLAAGTTAQGRFRRPASRCSVPGSQVRK
jgi:integrase